MVEQKVLPCLQFQTPNPAKLGPAKQRHKKEPEPADGVNLVKPWRWMHLEAKRLTEKYCTTKMFLLPIFKSFLIEIPTVSLAIL